MPLCGWAIAECLPRPELGAEKKEQLSPATCCVAATPMCCWSTHASTHRWQPLSMLQSIALPKQTPEAFSSRLPPSLISFAVFFSRLAQLWAVCSFAGTGVSGPCSVGSCAAMQLASIRRKQWKVPSEAAREPSGNFYPLALHQTL